MDCWTPWATFQSKLKKFLIFSQKSAFLILWENRALIFREISGLLALRIKNFRMELSKLKKWREKTPFWNNLLYFRKWNLPAPSNSYYFILSYISRRNFQSQKNKKFSYFSKKSYLAFRDYCWSKSLLNFLNKNNFS